MSEEERERLVIAHLGLVKSIAKRICQAIDRYDLFEDLVQEGTVALIEAVNRFDPDRGVRLATYAYPRIKGAMLNEEEIKRVKALLGKKELENRDVTKIEALAKLRFALIAAAFAAFIKQHRIRVPLAGARAAGELTKPQGRRGHSAGASWMKSQEILSYDSALTKRDWRVLSLW